MAAEYYLSKLTIPKQKWYVDMDKLGFPDIGQYYLALKDVDKTPKWVFAREQDGDNVFSIQFFNPVKPQTGIAFAQVQAEGFNTESKIERRAIATMHAPTATSLEATNWPDDWTRKDAKTPLPVDSRMFNLVVSESGSATMESILFKGYFVAVNKNAFMVEPSSLNFFVPALLSKTADPLHPIDGRPNIVAVEFKHVDEWHPTLKTDKPSELHSSL